MKWFKKIQRMKVRPSSSRLYSLNIETYSLWDCCRNVQGYNLKSRSESSLNVSSSNIVVLYDVSLFLSADL